MADLSSLTRYKDRRSTERAALDALLDEVLVGTLCSVLDGEPWAVPVLFARDGDRVLVHGSTGAGMLRHLAGGAPAVFSVHQVDALVLADSAFDHSANYRSAVLRGSLAAVPEKETEECLWLLTERILPGRRQEVRENLAKEVRATSMLALPIVEDGWIYKERTGGSHTPEDIAPQVWTGEVPLRTVAGQPLADREASRALPLPHSVQSLRERWV